jgi:hypothetical protein
MVSQGELPKKGEHIENNDEKVDGWKVLRTNRVSNGNHGIFIIRLPFKNKENLVS